jgi:hypothetical protein
VVLRRNTDPLSAKTPGDAPGDSPSPTNLRTRNPHHLALPSLALPLPWHPKVREESAQGLHLQPTTLLPLPLPASPERGTAVEPRALAADGQADGSRQAPAMQLGKLPGLSDVLNVAHRCLAAGWPDCQSLVRLAWLKPLSMLVIKNSPSWYSASVVVSTSTVLFLFPYHRALVLFLLLHTMHTCLTTSRRCPALAGAPDPNRALPIPPRCALWCALTLSLTLILIPAYPSKVCRICACLSQGIDGHKLLTHNSCNVSA